MDRAHAELVVAKWLDRQRPQRRSLLGDVEVEYAYYAPPPGWLGRDVRAVPKVRAVINLKTAKALSLTISPGAVVTGGSGD
jgi:hypothetical protein